MELLYTEKLKSGSDGAWNGTPSRAQDAQYIYSFLGWSLNRGATSADSNATKNVTADRSVYAAYSQTLRQYTATFARNSEDGGGTLATQTVNYGETPVYSGATPTTTKGDVSDYPFEGWTPPLGPITADTTYYAKFGSPSGIEVKEITDDWATICANIDNNTYATKYKVGNYKPLDLGTEGMINMQIVAIDNEEGPLVFISKELLANKYSYSSALNFIRTIPNLVPAVVSSHIKPVEKTTREYDSSEKVSVETVWIPSMREMGGSSNSETSGPVYNLVFTDEISRVKNIYGTFTSDGWWLRTARNNSSTNKRRVKNDGAFGNLHIQSPSGVCFGFVLSLNE